MRDLVSAMAEEQAYVADRMHGIETSLPDRLAPYGYQDLAEYFQAKRMYLFERWRPEVYPVRVETLTAELESAARNGKHGIYISVADGLYAFHGTNDIDYALCEELGVCVAELYHNGGTIIGSEKDLGIWICAPAELMLNSGEIIAKFHEIISKHVPGATIDGNDVLVNGEKVMGSMSRSVGNAFIWAAQVSFGAYGDVIARICTKQSTKKPGHIDSALLTRDTLESEVLAWLLKR